MEFWFNREWKQADIRRLVKENCYLDYGKHEDLKSLCCLPFAEDDDFYDSDYYELIFVVPTGWLIETARDLFGVNGIQNWLENEYVTDESEVIFAKALEDRKVVMVDFTV